MNEQPEPAAGTDDARLHEAREREAATREILEVISRSREDERPVFQVILERALGLCGAEVSLLAMVDEAREDIVMVACSGKEIAAFVPGVSSWPIRSDQNPAIAVRENRTVHTEDLRDTDKYRAGDASRRAIVDEEGMRTQLVIPLVGAGKAIGTLVAFRRQVKKFDDREIALLETFAAQAVIAIENVRQFRELQTRLEREAATREILEVISRSRDDEQPILDAIVRNAARLCGAPMAAVDLPNAAETELIARSYWGDGVAPEIAGTSYPLDGTHMLARSFADRITIHNEDIADDDLYRQGHPIRVRNVDEYGLRTILCVPLVKDNRALGVICIFRREVKPFSDEDIALVETFAAQAVIAIENVRQFRELQTRLEREAATREILEVISRSRDDYGPVFDAIVEQACRLCEAPFAAILMGTSEDSHFELAADRGTTDAQRALFAIKPMPMDPQASYNAMCVHEMRTIQVEDLGESELYRKGSEFVVNSVEQGGLRTSLWVPLTADDRAIGSITLFKREVKLFTPDQIALVETFAAQAVIAIENVRQFRAIQTANAELETLLEREAAGAEILSVISQSREDDNPVFEAIVRNAARLCDAARCALHILDKDQREIRFQALWGEVSPEFVPGSYSYDLDEPTHLARSVREKIRFHVVDLADDELYRSGYEMHRKLVDELGNRTLLAVPLLQGDEALGTIAVWRTEVKPFSNDEIALVETFAAQAVIAIENVRQFRALEILNAELETRVEDQVGEIERMGRLKRFLPPAVADAVVSSGSEAMLESHRALIGILFADIRGFTAFCEQAEPEETIEVLQTYHEEMGKLISAHAAGVDHRSGDGIMVIFNDPLPCDDPASEAVRLAVAMRARMAELCRKWRKLGHRLGFGVGVSLGYATVGMVGSEGRYEYTASGTAVNLAARLCDQAADGEILLSPRAFTAVEEEVEWEPGGELALKGLVAPVEVRKVVGLA